MRTETSSLIERRRHPRTQLEIQLRGIRLDPDGGDVVELLQTVDISRGGMGATAGRAFYPGQRILLCLPISGRRGRRNIYASVIRCRKREGRYRIGLEFDAASVDAWIGHSAATPVAAAA